MATRQVYSAASPGLSTTTSSTPAIKVTLTFTPDENSSYFIVAAATLQGIFGNGIDVDLRDVTAGTSFGRLDQGPADDTDIYSYIRVRRVTFGASPASQSYAIGYWSYKDGQQYSIGNALIVAIKAEPGDQYAESLSFSSTSATTPQDKVTLSFTPATAGEYVVLASTDVGYIDLGLACDILGNGTLQYGTILDTRWADGTGGHYGIHAWAFRTDSLSGPQTWKMRHWRASGTGGIKVSALAMLRADGFPAAYSGRNVVTTTTASTTPLDHLSISPTVAPSPHLVFGSMVTGDSGHGTTRFEIGGSAVSSDQPHHDPDTPTRGYGRHWMVFDTPPAAGSRTYALQQWRTASGATDNQETNESSIVVLQIEDSPSGISSRLAPDAILASSNLGASPAVASIRDDPDNPDTTWLDAVADNAASDLRVGFPSPAGNLVSGSGLQTFKIWVRKSASVASTPTLDVQLYEGGTLRGSLLSGVQIASDTGQLVVAPWDAADLAAGSGANVECRVVSTPVTDGVGPTPAYVASGTASIGTGTSVAPGYPSGLQADDLLILHVAARAATAPTVTTPSGWTQIFNDTSTVRRHYAAYKWATGLESGTQTVAISGTTVSNAAQIHAYRGVSKATPFEGGNVSVGSTASIGLAEVATTGVNRRVLACIMVSNDIALGNAAATYTEVAPETLNSDNTGVTLQLQSGEQATAGTVASTTVSMPSSNPWYSRTMALVPATAAAVSVDIGALGWTAWHEATVAISGSASATLAVSPSMSGGKLAARAGAGTAVQSAAALAAKVGAATATATAVQSAAALAAKVGAATASATAAASIAAPARKVATKAAACEGMATASAPGVKVGRAAQAAALVPDATAPPGVKVGVAQGTAVAGWLDPTAAAGAKVGSTTAPDAHAVSSPSASGARIAIGRAVATTFPSATAEGVATQLASGSAEGSAAASATAPNGLKAAAGASQAVAVPSWSSSSTAARSGAATALAGASSAVATAGKVATKAATCEAASAPTTAAGASVKGGGIAPATGEAVASPTASGRKAVGLPAASTEAVRSDAARGAKVALSGRALVNDQPVLFGSVHVLSGSVEQRAALAAADLFDAATSPQGRKATVGSTASEASATAATSGREIASFPASASAASSATIAGAKEAAAAVAASHVARADQTAGAKTAAGVGAASHAAMPGSAAGARSGTGSATSDVQASCVASGARPSMSAGLASVAESFLATGGKATSAAATGEADASPATAVGAKAALHAALADGAFSAVSTAIATELHSGAAAGDGIAEVDAAAGRKLASAAALAENLHAALVEGRSTEIKAGLAIVAGALDHAADGLKASRAGSVASGVALDQGAASGASLRSAAAKAAAFGSFDVASLRFLRSIALRGSWSGGHRMAASSRDVGPAGSSAGTRRLRGST